MTARPSRAPGRERGQALRLVALFVVVLLGFVGTVVDVGVAKVHQRRLQGSVDMAVLAAARGLPAASAAVTARQFLDQNHDGLPWSTSASTPTVFASNIQMTEKRTTPTAFLNLLGVETSPYRATATAAISTYSGFSNVAPWAVTRALVTPIGYTSDFQLRGRTDYGFASLRGTTSIRSGSSCGWSTGVDERRLLNRSLPVCEIGVAGGDGSGTEAVAETIQDDTGSSNGHLEGLQERGARACAASCLAEFTTAGSSLGSLRLTDGTHSNAILVPGITSWDRKDEMPVTGFVWFAITRWAGADIYGRFREPPEVMRADLACGARRCSEGPYEVGSPGGRIIRLVG